MTIYTLVLIKHTNETPTQDVHLFWCNMDARSYAFDWMFDLTNRNPVEAEQMDFDMLCDYCLYEDLGTVYIQEHTIQEDKRK